MSPTQSVGDMILGGRYRVVRSLGSGGMGEVFVAQDILEQRRQVALKALLPEAIGSRTVADLRQEFLTMAQCRHPNLAEVYDFGVMDGAGCFFTLEYVRGLDLIAAAREMSDRDVIRLFVQVSRGLHFLHSRGLVHFDVKPENILVARAIGGGEGRAKVLDFGLASPETQKAKGTVQYMAPEVLRGERADHRADLYSLGLVLYEAATGRTRFGKHTPSSTADLHDLAAGFVPDMCGSRFPEAMNQIVLKLTAAEPSARPRNAGLVADMLEGAADEGFARVALEDATAYACGSHFFGREKPLAALTKALERRSKKGGHAPLVLITGEAGVGKSRLLAEFRRECQLRGLLVVSTRCEEGMPRAFEPIAQVLKQFIGMIDDLPPAALECLHVHSAEVVRLVPELRDRGPVRQAPSLRPEDARARMTRSLSRLVADLGRIRPYVLFVENIQWADEGTLAVLNRAGVMSYEEGPLICCELRTSPPLSDAVSSFLRDAEVGRHTETVELDLLDEGSMAHMVESMFRSGQRLPQFAERIARESSGNPFFLEELIQYLIERGTIRRHHGEWVFPNLSAEEIEIPASVHSVLVERLDRLRPGPREVLGVLSAHNYPATPSAIVQLTSLGPREVADALDRLETMGLVAVAPGDPPSVAIKQTELQKAAYASMTEEELRALHREIGVAIEAEGADSSDDRIEELAHHFILAGDGSRALRYGLAAAEHLAELYSHARAVWLIESALNLEPTDMEEVARGWEMLGDSLVFIGHGNRARRAFGKALGRCGSALESVARARLCRKIGESYTIEAKFPRATRMLRRAESLLEDGGTSEDEALVLQAMGDVAHGQKRFEEAITTYRRGLAVLGGNHSSPAAGYLFNKLGNSYRNMKEKDKAVAAFRKSMAIWNRKGDLANVSRCLNNLGTVHLTEGDLSAAERCFEQSLSAKRKIGLERGLCVTLGNLGLAYQHRGHYVRATPLARQAARMAEELGDVVSFASAAYRLAALSFRTGAYEQAIGEYRKSIRLAEAHQPSLTACGWGGMAEAFMEIGFLDRARRLANHGHAVARKHDDMVGEGFCMGILGEIHSRQGNPAEANRHFDAWRECAERAGNRKEVCASMLRTAHLALEQGLLDRAETLADEALSISEELESEAQALHAAILRTRMAAVLDAFSVEAALSCGRGAVAQAGAIDSPELKWQAFLAFAECHEKAGNWRYALHYCRRCVDIIESIRSRISRRRWRGAYAASYVVRLVAAATERLLDKMDHHPIAGRSSQEESL